MSEPSIAFIGLGLIGGSIAKGIKREHPKSKIMAYMRSKSKLLKAQEEGIVDVVLDGIGEELKECDLIFLCAPVEYNANYLEQIKPYLKSGAIITDVGSTKTDIHEAVIRAGLEHCFVGGHPMAGSEKTGYENSSVHLLENAYYIITPTALSSEDQVNHMVDMGKSIGSIPLVMDYKEHDFVTAAISHLPHIVASSMVNLVKDSDNSQELMRRLSAGGFKDITRIASSSPEMWEQICMTNSNNLSLILKRYIDSLNDILKVLEAKDNQYIYQLFETSRDYRNSFSEKATGPIESDYFFTVNMADEVGAISTLAVILASKGISIKNIGINHNREHGEGTLRIAFYDKESMDNAWKQLEKYHYDLIPN
ncbi:prephenate dehydrogenase [Lacrimispora algidixylanolytica]|uniref:Prephenate dehydrogenase n=1 Tax=Lacrimispora algidixylanolytica TaxID=94868 RepID=A0A419SW43_9FIRM|nr:prephenate dehydrogenase [Lacrimispora algidixylanolytica]RKD29429.1 prephenate dehydrogenase [Lacrimispora algidixylanolytica]